MGDNEATARGNTLTGRGCGAGQPQTRGKSRGITGKLIISAGKCVPPEIAALVGLQHSTLDRRQIEALTFTALPSRHETANILLEDQNSKYYYALR